MAKADADDALRIEFIRSLCSSADELHIETRRLMDTLTEASPAAAGEETQPKRTERPAREKV